MPAPILFLETSTPRASVALVRAGIVAFRETFSSDRSHNSGLFGPLARALAELHEGEKLGFVVIGTGPGSYSGTRVGIAAGQGVALVHGCPAVGLPSLLAVPAASAGALAVGDARRGGGWWAEIVPTRATVEPTLAPYGEVSGKVSSALASGAEVFSLEPADKVFPSAGSIAVLQPDAEGLATAWNRLDPSEKETLVAQAVQPVYLRPPHVTEAKPGHPLLRK